MGEGHEGDMGAWDSEVKGVGLMILEFCYRLITVVQPRHRRVVFGLITIVFAGAAIPTIAEQIIKSALAVRLVCGCLYSVYHFFTSPPSGCTHIIVFYIQ